jgi:hypothetical protein
MAKRYISWEKSAENIGFVPMSKQGLGLIFDKLGDKTIKKIADKVGKTIPRALILLNYHEISFENFINTIELWDSRYGSVSHDIVGTKHTFTIFHGITKKFSYYIAEVHSAAAEDLSCNFTITSIDENMLVMELQEFA